MGVCTDTFEENLILRTLLFANYTGSLESRQGPLRRRGRKKSWARKTGSRLCKRGYDGNVRGSRASIWGTNREDAIQRARF